MGFEHALKEMVDGIDGSLAGVISGRDGIAVGNYVKQGIFDIESVAVESNRIIEDIKRASEVLNLENIDEVIISARNCTVITRLINEDYFISLIIKSDRITGRARFVLKKTASMIADEF